MAQETFTMEQIKAAFIARFHKAGELWFDYLGTEEENRNSSELIWLEFLKHLRKEQQHEKEEESDQEAIL